MFYHVGGIPTTPTFTDIDSDGLLDLIVSQYYQLVRYEQNTANADSFTRANFDVYIGTSGTIAKPTFTDLDGDGLLDMIMSRGNNIVQHYEQNVVNSSNFNEIAYYFSGINSGSSPTFTDFDGDGLLDMIVGNGDGTLRHFKQEYLPVISALSVACQGGDVNITGTSLTGATSVTLNGISVGTLSNVTANNITFSVPANASSGNVVVTTPIGTSNEMPLTVNPLIVINNFGSSATAMDSSLVINGANFNGVTSVRFGETPARYTVNSNTQITATVPRVANTGKIFLSNTNGCATLSPSIPVTRQSSINVFSSVSTTLAEINGGTTGTPTFTDLDGDGLLDMIVGKQDGTLSHYEQNTSNSTSFTLITANFNAIDAGYASAPTFTDLDGDGLLDMLVGVGDGRIAHYEQNTANSPSFTLITDFFNSMRIHILPLTPTITDLDGDGLLDMIIGKQDGTLSHYEQNASNSISFTLITANFNAIDVGNRSAPTFTDLDGDGLLDMIVGKQDGSLSHFEQNTANSTVFTLISENFNGIDVGDNSAPTFTDLDGDGLLDLIIGELDNVINHYEQIQSPVIYNLSANSACEGAAVSIRGIGFTGATSVAINGTTIGTLSTVSPTNINFIVPAGVSSGNLVVTTPNGTSNALPITINPVLNTPVISGINSICQGQSTVLTSNSPVGNRWSTGDTTRSITVNAIGSYTVRVVSGACTSVVSEAFAVSLNNSVSAPSITGANTICAGDSTILTSSIAIGNLWSTGDTTRRITVTTAGSYTVRSIVGPCTSSNSIAIIVTEEPTPEIPVIRATRTNLIGSDSCVLTVNNLTPNAVYEWSNGQLGRRIVIRNSDTVRVRAVLNNCASDYSIPVIITGIANKALTNILQVFPNPAFDKVTIRTTSIGALEIVNAVGQPVFTTKAQPEMELNLGHLAKGVYMVQVQSNKGLTTQRLVIQ
jgi:uncharacterized protein (DUF2141 family)